MAGDTRDSNQPQPRGPPPGETAPPAHLGAPKIYEVFDSSPNNANALPEGYGQNTAGGRPDNPNLSDAVKTLRLGDFKQIHMYPCVRESLLTAIGGGFAIGGVRVLMGGM
jgi:cytochrome c oxidase assembly protein subunit 20